jgi:hypothetical protein
VFVGEPEAKRPLRIPMRRWESNIEIVLEKYDGKVWTEDRDQRWALVNTVMNLRLP